MREIKFRAWDKEEKLIREVSNINFSIGESSGKDIEVYNQDMGYYERVHDYELMQYIGFNDINGTEIYEGDIIDIGNGELFVVAWSEYYKEFSFFKKGHYFDKTYRGTTRNNWEVVGNIFENKIEDMEERDRKFQEIMKVD